VLRVAVPLLKCGRDSCMHVIFRHVRAIELGLRRAVVAGPRPVRLPRLLTERITRATTRPPRRAVTRTGLQAFAPTHQNRTGCKNCTHTRRDTHASIFRITCRHSTQHTAAAGRGSSRPAIRSLGPRCRHTDPTQPSCMCIQMLVQNLPIPPQPATTCDHDEDFHATYPSDHGQKGSCISRAGMSPCPPWRREGVCMRSRARRLNPFWGQPDLGLSEIVRAPD